MFLLSLIHRNKPADLALSLLFWGMEGWNGEGGGGSEFFQTNYFKEVFVTSNLLLVKAKFCIHLSS